MAGTAGMAGMEDSERGEVQVEQAEKMLLAKEEVSLAGQEAAEVLFTGATPAAEEQAAKTPMGRVWPVGHQGARETLLELHSPFSIHPAMLN